MQINRGNREINVVFVISLLIECFDSHTVIPVCFLARHLGMLLSRDAIFSLIRHSRVGGNPCLGFSVNNKSS